jgi:hypothetical protein
MGAILFLMPQEGQFELRQITMYLSGVQGLFEAEGDPHFVSFSDGLFRRRVRKALDLRERKASEHRSPYLRYSPTLIEFGVNWGDNRRGDGRRCLEWLLSSFSCSGLDDTGYRYQSSAHCRVWLNHWLPVPEPGQTWRPLMSFEDIPGMAEQEARFEEITLGCHDEYERLSAFELYLTHALRLPFEALWELGASTVPVTVLGVAESDDEEGVRLRVRHADTDEQVVPAVQVRAAEASVTEALVLDDYRAFVQGGGLPFSVSEW